MAFVGGGGGRAAAAVVVAAAAAVRGRRDRFSGVANIAVSARRRMPALPLRAGSAYVAPLAQRRPRVAWRWQPAPGVAAFPQDPPRAAFKAQRRVR